MLSFFVLFIYSHKWSHKIPISSNWRLNGNLIFVSKMERVESVLRLAEYEIADSQQEGLADDVLEGRLHGPRYLGRVQF